MTEPLVPPNLRLPPVLSKSRPHAEVSAERLDSYMPGQIAALLAPQPVPVAPPPTGDMPRQAEAERPWLDKPALADHFSCSIRWVEQRMEDGMPHAHIAGRAKFRLAVVTEWLTENDHIDQRGEVVS